VQHVLDSSAPNIEKHRSSVLQVLQQIGVSQEKMNNMIEVWNKVPRDEFFYGQLDCWFGFSLYHDVCLLWNFRLISWMRMLHLMGLKMRSS
jgi:hypothetical protein